MPEAATLFKEWSGYLKPEDVTRLETAYHFSKAAHNGQFRDSGDPYISHPLAVARCKDHRRRGTGRYARLR